MALVIGRRQGESIEIAGPDGDLITVEVVMVLGAKVRLGVTAPDDWRIERRQGPARHEPPRRRPPN